ncbi:MAG: branched-chain amino acid ABC transporter permease [Thermoleophilia bacterium]|nr:branched-chain amino acid ABC transporter permease [Thermoleophilia bacterium]
MAARFHRPDPRRTVVLGIAGGLTAVFLSAIGMVEEFIKRSLVDPEVVLGYVTIALVPFVFAYVVARPPPVREGIAPVRPGPLTLAAGAVAGLLTASVVSLFVVITTEVNVRGVLQNVSPPLLETLTFHRGVGQGVVWLLVGGTLIGAGGAAVHLIPARYRRPVVLAVVWVLIFGLLQVLIAQIFRGLKVGDTVNPFLYKGSRGLTIHGAITVWIAAFLIALSLEGQREAMRRRLAEATPAVRRNYMLVGLAVALLILAVTPQILGNFLSEVLDLAGIFLLMALGLNIVVGYAGLLDLGYVAFFAVGAYTGAVLTSPSSPEWNPAFTFWAAIPFIMVAAALAGIIVGTPVLRMRGDYLAIVTLGFGEIARILFLSDALKPYFGGAQGIIRVPNISIGPVEFVTSQDFFYIIYALAIVLIYVSWALQHSRVGRAWMAMREDETVAEVMGVNIVAAKLQAFIIGAILASLGGALFAHKIGSIFPHSFNIVVSITVLMCVIVGGMGSIPGVILGAIVLVGAPELLREFSEFKFLLYGALLIFMMQMKPEGLIPSRQRAQELHQDEAAQDAWLRREALGDTEPEPAK